MAQKKDGGDGLNGLDAMFKNSARELLRAGTMCRKEGGGAACAGFDMAALMVTGARGLAANALQGTTGDAATVAASTGSKMGEVKSAKPVGEVTEVSEEDADDDA